MAQHSTAHLCLLDGPHRLPEVGQPLAAAAEGAAGLARPPRAAVVGEQAAGEAALQGGGARGAGRRAAVAHRAQQGRQGVRGPGGRGKHVALRGVLRRLRPPQLSEHLCRDCHHSAAIAHRQPAHQAARRHHRQQGRSQQKGAEGEQPARRHALLAGLQQGLAALQLQQVAHPASQPRHCPRPGRQQGRAQARLGRRCRRRRRRSRHAAAWCSAGHTGALSDVRSMAVPYDHTQEAAGGNKARAQGEKPRLTTLTANAALPAQTSWLHSGKRGAARLQKPSLAQVAAQHAIHLRPNACALIDRPVRSSIAASDRRTAHLGQRCEIATSLSCKTPKPCRQPALLWSLDPRPVEHCCIDRSRRLEAGTARRHEAPVQTAHQGGPRLCQAGARGRWVRGTGRGALATRGRAASSTAACSRGGAGSELQHPSAPTPPSD